MNITLIGMAGAGKTVIGKELARRLDYEFLDTDEIIEEKAKSKLQELLDDLGERGFVGLEERAVLEIGTIERCVVSPGGSVVYSPKAMNFLKERSTVVFLNVPFTDIEIRIKNQQTRGIVGLKEKNLKKLYDERQQLYRNYADIEIDLPEHFGIDMTVRKLLQEIFGGCMEDTGPQGTD